MSPRGSVGWHNKPHVGLDHRWEAAVRPVRPAPLVKSQSSSRVGGLHTCPHAGGARLCHQDRPRRGPERPGPGAVARRRCGEQLGFLAPARPMTTTAGGVERAQGGGVREPRRRLGWRLDPAGIEASACSPGLDTATTGAGRQGRSWDFERRALNAAPANTRHSASNLPLVGPHVG